MQQQIQCHQHAQLACDSTVSQLLQHVNDLENRVRMVGLQIAEEDTRRSVTTQEEQRLALELEHLSQRERDLKVRMHHAASQNQAVSMQLEEVRTVLQVARAEAPVVAEHTRRRLRDAESDAEHWAAMTSSVSNLPPQWRALLGQGETWRSLEATEARIQQLRSQQCPAAQGTESAENRTEAAARLVDRLSALQRDEDSAAATFARHRAALLREVSSLEHQLNEVRQWQNDVAAALSHQRCLAVQAAEMHNRGVCSACATLPAC